jgi:batB protein
MFQFAHPEYLYALLLIPLLVALFIYSQWRNYKRQTQWGSKNMFLRLVNGLSIYRVITKFFLQLIALALLIFLLAQPQYGLSSGKPIKKQGIEVIFALDVSQSMLAQDVQPSRLERSKLLISTLAERMPNNKIGLNIFAGEAYPILPLTNDLVSANLFLDQISTDMVSLQGTNLGAAIRLADKSFSNNKKVGKAIVVITDGENHEEGAVDAARLAANSGKHVFVLGVGSTSGAQIPTPEGILTDNSGAVVKTALNEEACIELAQAGKGQFFHVDGTNSAQEQLQQVLSQLQEAESSYTNNSAPNELFPWIASLLLIILLLELFLAERQQNWWRKLSFLQR